jgi:hypothetical protein
MLISFTLRPLYRQRKSPPPPIGLEAGWAPEPAWTLWSREKFLAPTRNRTPAVQRAARRYAEWAIPAPLYGSSLTILNALLGACLRLEWLNGFGQCATLATSGRHVTPILRRSKVPAKQAGVRRNRERPPNSLTLMVCVCKINDLQPSF